MIHRYTLYLLFFLSALFSGCVEQVPFAFSHELKLNTKDSIQFAEKDYDDSLWVNRLHSDSIDGIFWARISITIPDSILSEEMAIKILSPASYEFYWDGRYVGSNGKLPTLGKEEIQGSYVKNFVLTPEQLEAKHHTIALRSAFSCSWEHEHHAIVIISSLDQIMVAPIRFSLWLFVLMGVFLAVAVYFMISFVYDIKDIGALLFSIICLVVILLLGLEYIKHTHAYPYSFQRTRLQLIHGLHLALALLVPLFLMVKFEVKKIWTIILFVLLALVCIHYWESSYDKAAMLLNRFMWIISMGLMIYAMIKKRKESIVLLVALVLSYLAHIVAEQFFFFHVSSYDVSLFVEYLIIALSMLYLTIYRQRQERQEYEESLVVSERLRNELLRKNIRPHFIMNTLTSLMDWVEESPKMGVQFIDALASEFRLLNDMVDHKLVSIGEEIKLCKYHLKVMEFRKAISYNWHEEGVSETEFIPPAILLTIVENGVTHSYGKDLSKVDFYLEFRKENDFKEYVLRVVTDDNCEPSNNRVSMGTGTKYIKSRLHESYGDNWTYKSEPTNNGWKTMIKIGIT